jgi:hypothetical protein
MADKIRVVISRSPDGYSVNFPELGQIGSPVLVVITKSYYS